MAWDAVWGTAINEGMTDPPTVGSLTQPLRGRAFGPRGRGSGPKHARKGSGPLAREEGERAFGPLGEGRAFGPRERGGPTAR